MIILGVRNFRVFEILEHLPYNLGLDARNPVFGVGFKPTCSATETSLKTEISLVASLDMILSNK